MIFHIFRELSENTLLLPGQLVSLKSATSEQSLRAGYEVKNGYHLPSKARLIYRKPQEDFCYGEFVLRSIEYNCTNYD
jgi:hypothetical protein